MNYGGKEDDHTHHMAIDTAQLIPPKSYDVLLQLLEKAECQIKRSAYISK
jgi:hypothetical protein